MLSPDFCFLILRCLGDELRPCRARGEVWGSDVWWDWEKSSMRKWHSWISSNYLCKTRRQMRESQPPGTLNEETAS